MTATGLSNASAPHVIHPAGSITPARPRLLPACCLVDKGGAVGPPLRYGRAPVDGRGPSTRGSLSLLILGERLVTGLVTAQMTERRAFRFADTFDVEALEHAARLFITAQEILVDLAGYPSAKIARNSHDFRPLGLGFANLGALLMSYGLPYDSDEGRSLAGALMAVEHFAAYSQSSRIASLDHVGPFPRFAENRDAFIEVMHLHRDAAYRMADYGTAQGPGGTVPVAAESSVQPEFVHGLWNHACFLSDEMISGVKEHGARNAQATVLAPCGTISFFMDCDTTGIEPGIALVSYKLLAGEGDGSVKIVNQTVRQALVQLGYGSYRLPSAKGVEEGTSEIDRILRHIEEHDTIEGAPYLKDEHLPVFDCAFKAMGGTRSIGHLGHLKMMAACQPFISGAIGGGTPGAVLTSTSTAFPAPEGIRNLWSRTPSHSGDGRTLCHVSPWTGSSVVDREQPSWRIGLSDGRELTGSSDERVRVATEEGLAWKTIADLCCGEYVAVRLGAETWEGLTTLPIPEVHMDERWNAVTFPETLTPRLAWFLGAMTADGHVVRTNYRIGITKNEPAVHERFAEAVRLFGLTAKHTVDPRNGVHGSETNSKALMLWLDTVGFSKEGVPDVIRRSTRPNVLAYLSGLYLDGYVSASVSISQKSAALIADVQTLWDNLGVKTYVNANVVDGTNYPVLHVEAPYRTRAAALVEWVEPHKDTAARKLKDGKDRAPFPIGRETLKRAVREQRRTQEFRNLLDRRTKAITRRTALAAAEALGVEIDAEAADYVFVAVESIKEEGGVDRPLIPQVEANGAA